MSKTITRRHILLSATALTVCALSTGRSFAAPRKRYPNIVYIYADDLGYGDIGCYGATRVATPNIDRLAAQGLRMTNAHSPSATCTPSRYALLTGEYAWRQDGAHILPGDAPALIQPGKFTLPTMLRDAGYKTGVVGKWHLGLGNGTIDWNKPIAPGPREIGFDYAYYIPATIDRVPCVYIEDRTVVGLDAADPIRVDYRTKVGTDPTGKENPDELHMTPNDGHDGTIVDGVSRIGWMSGGKAARWRDENMADHLTGKAIAFMEQSTDAPFFLYFATNEIHVPRRPALRFRGKSPMGPRGDVILELDWIVGEMMAAIDRLGIAEETMIVFSSDNGPVLNDGYNDEAAAKVGDHKPAGPLRSGKYAIYEGGLRVPMIVRWKGHVPVGSVSAALVDHVDMLASFAALVDRPLPTSAGLDSLNMLPAILGTAKAGRSYVIEDTSTSVAEKSTLTKTSGNILALIEGQWKMIEAAGPKTSFHGNEIGSAPAPQLFDLSSDPGERTDLAAHYPDRIKAMTTALNGYRSAGRTRRA